MRIEENIKKGPNHVRISTVVSEDENQDVTNNNAINKFLNAHSEQRGKESPRKITTVNRLGYLDYESVLMSKAPKFSPKP